MGIPTNVPLPPRPTRRQSSPQATVRATVLGLALLLAVPAPCIAVPAAVDQYREQPPPAGPGGEPYLGGSGGPPPSGSDDGGPSAGASAGGRTGSAADGGRAAGDSNPESRLLAADEAGEAGGSTLPLTGYRVTPFVLWIAVIVAALLVGRTGYGVLMRTRPGTPHDA